MMLVRKQPKHANLQMLQLEQSCYFPIIFPFGNYNYENMFNSLFVTIGGSNKIFICLYSQWSWEHFQVWIRETTAVYIVIMG